MNEINLDISKELQMLNDALQENETLFNEVYTHYNSVKKGGSGTLSFVEKQTANLVGLKANKLNIIQQIVNSKKIDAETKLKILTANKGEDGEERIIKQVADSMYDLILKNKKERTFEEILGSQKNIEVEQKEEDVDALLEARLNEENTQQEKKTEETAVEEFFYVVDMEKNIYCVDKDYNLIEDASIPDVTITIKEEDGEVIAKDEHGNIYDVVEFD